MPKIIKKKPTVKKLVKKKEVLEKKEKIVAPKIVEEKIEEESDRYFEAVGRRKTAVARVRLFTKGDKEVVVNNKPFNTYFQDFEFQEIAMSSLKKMKCLDRFRVSIIIKGGGLHAQAEAVRHGTAMALTKFNNDFRKRLKRVGYLTRDSRMRERKKPGLKRARRAPQWSKR